MSAEWGGCLVGGVMADSGIHHHKPRWRAREARIVPDVDAEHVAAVTGGVVRVAPGAAAWFLGRVGPVLDEALVVQLCEI